MSTTLSSPTNGATISTVSATGTITNDDNNAIVPPSLAIAATNAVKPEGNTGTTPFTFTVTRTGNITDTSSAKWFIGSSNDDFVTTTGSINFDPGEASKIITVNVKGDTIIERNETFRIQLHSPVNATISTDSAIGTIISDDTPLQGIAVAGNYAYAVGQDGLQIIDITKPANPITISGYDTSGSVRNVEVVGNNYAYVPNMISGLQIIDIKNPTNPNLIGIFNTYNTTGVKVTGNYAYVANGPSGLQIIDIRNPTQPALVVMILLAGLGMWKL